MRVLYDAAAAILQLTGIDQLFHFDAHGNLLNIVASQAATSYLYNGEPLDANTGKQYLRARWYDPTTGTFNRLDPFFGDLEDPQSLHKYVFAHGDPIQNSDPSGLFSLVGISVSMGISSNIRATNSAPQLGVLNSIRTASQFANLATRAYDTFSAVSTFVDLLTFDPSDLLDITKALKKFDGFDILDDMSGLVRLPNKLIKTPRGQIALPDLKIKGRLGKLFMFVAHSNKGQELIGEVGASLVAGLLGFETTAIIPAYHGIDAILYNHTLDKWLILEAKGGTSRLGRTKGHGKQMSHPWITDRLRKIIDENRRKGGDHKIAADKLRKAYTRNQQMLAMVVSLDIRVKDRLKLGMQPFSRKNGPPLGGFDNWTGF